jgi:serine/threonine protein kinase/TolB-like protein/Flp pilus assembly protein TadD
MPPSVGMRFGRYQLLARLGAGGMGEVWSALDQDLQREVAIKFLPERYASDPQRMSRFAQEARAASSLNHPNIVTIHEIGETAGLPYIVMERVMGTTLHELVRDGEPVPARRVLEIGAQIAEGLAKAHAAGIVHRDLKPDNVMVTGDGFAKILDFGLAKLFGDAAGNREQWFDSHAPTQLESPGPQTDTGVVLGTVGYMSPEQARGRPVDYRSDQFALGSILYELATARPAFRRESAAQTLVAIMEEAPEPIAVRNPTFPAQVRWLIENRCLAKEPAERYASTVDLARELRDLRARLSSASDTGSLLALPTVPARPRRPSRLTRWLLATGAALVIAAGGAVSWWLGRASHVGSARPLVVAVLPLTNLTGQAADDAAAAGITEVVVTSLTQLPEVQVLSRLATVRYANRKSDIVGVARELDATYLLDGTLQRSQDQVRVSLSLVKGASNVVAWSGTFDGAFPRIFDLQSRVADGVAGALRLSIPPELRQKIEARPTASPEAWSSYADALALLDRRDRPGNVERAVSLLERAIALDPRFARAHAALARASKLAYEASRVVSWADRARDEAQEALRLDPNDAGVRIELARIYSMRGRTAQALDEARMARTMLPNSDETARVLATILVAAGQPEAALAEASRAVALRPAFAENHFVLAWTHFNAGRFVEAAGEYRLVAEQQPDNAQALQMLGASLHAAGDLEGAMRAYRDAIRVAPDAPSWANLGAVASARGDTTQALRAFEEAARLEPGSATIRKSLGDARRRAGDAAGARADWQVAAELSRAALKVNPRDPRHPQNLALCLAKLGRTAEALRTARDGLAAAPSSADASYGAAAVYSLAGDRKTSLELLAKAIALGASPVVAAQDDDFSSLKGTKEFETLLSRAAARSDK